MKYVLKFILIMQFVEKKKKKTTPTLDTLLLHTYVPNKFR